MSRISRRLLLASSGAALLAGCAPTLPARSDQDPLEGGIGGTGIVGVLSDFGSLLIAGLSLTHSAKVETHPDLGNAELAVGQSLTVFAQAQRSRIVARYIRRTPPLAGPRGRPGRPGAAFSVNGVDVVTEPGTLGQLPGTNQRVVVHGVWRGDAVVASRFETGGNQDMIAGTLARRSGRLVLGTTPLDIDAPHLQPGTYATAFGRFVAGRLQVDTLDVGRFGFQGGPQITLDQLAIEGFLEPSAQLPGHRISGLGHSFDASAKVSDLAGRRAVYFGPYTGAFATRQALGFAE